MTDEARNIALGAGVSLILLVASCELRAQGNAGIEIIKINQINQINEIYPTNEYLKQILRLQTTEFCATVGRPPQVIADALNKALEQEPRVWLPAVTWWNQIVDKYKAARCGDA